jgi:hypothetical protein
MVGPQHGTGRGIRRTVGSLTKVFVCRCSALYPTLPCLSPQVFACLFMIMQMRDKTDRNVNDHANMRVNRQPGEAKPGQLEEDFRGVR